MDGRKSPPSKAQENTLQEAIHKRSTCIDESHKCPQAIYVLVLFEMQAQMISKSQFPTKSWRSNSLNLRTVLSKNRFRFWVEAVGRMRSIHKIAGKAQGKPRRSLFIWRAGLNLELGSYVGNNSPTHFPE
ncbi:hypothetical protein ACLBWS_02305 [Brucellaceae bacterium D45D]